LTTLSTYNIVFVEAQDEFVTRLTSAAEG
jgi:hypothetical protein